MDNIETPIPSQSHAPPIADERRLVHALRVGDEAAFVEVVERYTPSMLRVAQLYVRNEAVAQEIVQETWIDVLKALDKFEGRSSLRTWLFAILANRARKRSKQEGRSSPLSSLEHSDQESSVQAERFFPSTHPRWANMWSSLVASWDEIPDEELLGGEGREQLRRAMKELPARYATVFVLRDVEGWSGEEVSTLLGISSANQRVLLHRARSRIRTALEEYFERTDR